MPGRLGWVLLADPSFVCAARTPRHPPIVARGGSKGCSRSDQPNTSCPRGVRRHQLGTQTLAPARANSANENVRRAACGTQHVANEEHFVGVPPPVTESDGERTSPVIPGMAACRNRTAFGVISRQSCAVRSSRRAGRPSISSFAGSRLSVRPPTSFHDGSCGPPDRSMERPAFDAVVVQSHGHHCSRCPGRGMFSISRHVRIPAPSNELQHRDGRG
jgi:hypothetical protein